MFYTYDIHAEKPFNQIQNILLGQCRGLLRRVGRARSEYMGSALSSLCAPAKQGITNDTGNGLYRWYSLNIFFKPGGLKPESAQQNNCTERRGS